MDIKAVWWIYWNVLLPYILTSCYCSESERLLVYDLFKKPGYNPLIRPVNNISDAIEVDLGITLFQVITIEERTQVMKTNNWIRMKWKDYQLRWDPNQYEGITSIRLPCGEVWKPDIVLLNNADGKYEQSYCSNVVLENTGDILWIPPSIYKSSCTIDVQYFPFDQQKCDMIFGSWTYSADQVKLGLEDDRRHCDLSNYVFSGTWDLMGCPAQISEDKKKYSEVKYNMILRRKTLFYTVNLLTPCILISFLSVLTFYLPADAQEKVTLCISILLALVVFLLLVSKSLPPTSVTMPLISKYLFFTFIMNIITVIVSVAIININFRSPRTYKMPRWIRLIFLYWLPIIMFMKRPEHEEKYNKWSERKQQWRGTNNVPCRAANGGELGIEMGELKLNETRGSHRSTPQLRRDTTRLSPKAFKALEAVEFIVNHLKTVDDYEEVCDDWKYVAGVLDRFLLYVFLVITVAGTVSIIIDAPHIFETVDQAAIVNRTQSGV